MYDAFINYSAKIERKEFTSQLYYRLFNDMEDTGSESEDLNINNNDSESNLVHELNIYNFIFKQMLYAVGKA